MKSILAGTALLLALSGAAVAETWNVVEGRDGDTRGVWQVTMSGSSIQGSADMLMPKGRRLKYHVSGEIRDGKFVMHRIAPNERTDCVYVAPETRALSFAGSVICDGTSNPWRVVRKPN
jgi:hypothetical protein